MQEVLKTEKISSNIVNKSSEKMIQVGTCLQGTIVNSVRYVVFPTAFAAAPIVQASELKGSIQFVKIVSMKAGSFGIQSKGTPLYNAKAFTWMAYGSV